MNQNQKITNQNEIESIVSNFLEHHQIKGGKWGVMHGPPYPLNHNKDKQAKLKAKAKARQAKEKAKVQKRIAKAQSKAENREKKEAKDAERKEAKLAKDKKKYSKSPEQLYKHRDMYSYQEIADALQKFEWENKIKDYMDKDMIRAKNRAETMAKSTQSVVSFAKSMIDGYNVAVGVTNALGIDMKPVKIPSSSGEQKKDNKD